MRTNTMPPAHDDTATRAAHELLDRLKKEGIQVALSGKNLKLSSTGGKVASHFLEEIKANKKALVSYLSHLQKREFPASFAQQRLWYADALAGNNSYHLSELMHLQGPLDVEVLHQIFEVVIERHQVLRTRFKEQDGALLQLVGNTTFSLQLVELSADQADIRAQIYALVEEEAKKPFDLQHDNLIRVYVFRESAESHWLFINLHHVIADGWSVGVLTGEIVALYEKIRAGEPAQLEPLVMQYADYSLWQQTQMESGAFERQLDYWRGRLKDCPVLALPTDFPRPARQSTRGTSHTLDFGAELSGALKAFCKSVTASPFMVLLSVFYILMQRYSRQDDLVVGTSIANRNRSEFENLIGLFVNVLAVRQNLSDNPSFDELVQNVKFHLLDDYENQDVPFEKVVDACEAKRDPSRSPLFQVAFTVENTPMRQLALGDLQISSVPLPGATAKYDLTFHIQEEGNRFVADIEYCTDLFSATSIETMGRCYLNLLMDALAHPERHIDELQLLSEAQLLQVTALACGEAKPLPDKHLVQLFEECARDFSDNPALVAPDHAPLELWPSISEFYVYDDLLYYAMTNDEKRNQSYRVAINKLVPGKTVLEIGTGPDVILSRFAVAAGARHVYAVELLQETYLKARETIERLGLQDKITLIHGDATKVELPEKVDIILSEIVGAIGGSEGCTVIQNQTRKFLKADGKVIPHRSLTTITPIALPEDFFAQPGFSTTSAPYVAKIFNEIGHPFDLRLCVKNMQYADLVANVEPFEDLVFSDYVKEEDRHPVTFHFHKDCAIDGFLLWLNLETLPGEWIDALAHEHCWLPVYVPVFEQKIPVEQGDSITADIERRLCDNGINPTFVIQGKLHRKGAGDVVFSACLDHFTETFGESAFHRKIFSGGEARLRPDLYRTFTYAELDKKANQLAHFLQSRDVFRGKLVGICLKKSWQSVVATLAVLKTGAAYLPIDPDYPKSRIDYIVENSAIDLLISAKDLANVWQGLNLPVVDVISAAAEVAEYSAHNPIAELSPQDLAYVIYTSGSTGNPKGVMIEHRSAVNLRQAQVHQFGVAEGDRILQFAPQAFDAAASEWLMALLTGATLVVPAHGIAGDPDRLSLCIRDHGVNVATLPPVVLSVMDPQALPGLTTLISAGEACTRELCNRWSPGRRFFNAYGPTENTVCSSIYECAAQEEQDPPIGRVMDNQQALVLDAQLNCLPAGVPGELCMAGVGLARGYLNNASLTEQSFITLPWHDGRVYRTGDLVRLDAQGILHYLGRRDNQVKIRGHRIELGEVEYQLRKCPDVRDAACVVREDGGSKQLYAFVMGGEKVSADAVQRQLAEKVPAYMVPARILVVDEYPTTANGKVDKVALLVLLEKTQGAVDGHLVLPRTEREAQLVRWYTELLGVRDVSITDSFFELGGDSILAVQLVAKCRQAGFSLRVSDVFEKRTPIALAQACRVSSQSVQTQQGLQTGEVRLTPIQHWFFAQDFPQAHHWNQSVLLTLPKSITQEVLRSALRALYSHHDALRLGYNIRGEDAVKQAYRNQLDLECQVVDLRSADAEEISAAIQKIGQAQQQSMTLEEGPLLRATLFLTGSDHTDNQLALIAHHLVVDVHSWRVLLEDFSELLKNSSLPEKNNSLPEQNNSLPEKTSSFQFYAQRLQDYANSPKCEMHLPYWQEVVDQLAQDELREMLVNHAEEAVDNVRRTSVTVTLDAATSARLSGPALQAYQTQVPDLLLAAVRLALQDCWNVRHFGVAMESHGRHDFDACVDVTRTVGWFTTHYPLVFAGEVGLDGNLIRETKEALRAPPNRGFDYAALRYLHTNPNVRRSLVSEREPALLLNYLGQMEQQGSSGPLQLLDVTPGEDLGAQNPPSHPLVVTAAFAGNQLSLELCYDAGRLRESDISELAGHTCKQLKNIVDFCCGQTQSRHTPSDFPLISLSQRDVDELDDAHPTLQDVWPLTKSQEGMFFGSLASGGKAFVEQMVLEIKGDVDPQKLAQCWLQVQRVNPLLHSRVHILGQRLCFVLRKGDEPPPIYENNLCADSGESVQVALQYAQRARQAGFDLRCESGCQLAILGIAPRHYALVLTVSHVLMDGWSHANLMSQLLAVYQGEVIEAQPFSTYLQWIQRQDRGLSEAYWKHLLTLSGKTEKLCDPQPVEHLENARLSSVAAELSQCELNRLEEMTRQHGVLLNALLQSAWGVLLGAYTGGERAIFGYTTSGRPEDLVDADKIIGLFINTLPIVMELGRADIWQLAAQVQQQTLAHGAHQYFSAGEIQTAAGRTSPLYDSIVVFENYPLDDIDRAADTLGLTDMIHHAVEGGETGSPLTLLIKPERTLGVELVFDAARLNAEAMTQLVADYKALLQMLLKGESCTADLQAVLGSRCKPTYSVQRAAVTAGPINETECQVHTIYCALTGETEVSVEDNFFDLGGHSLLALQLLHRLNHTFSCNLSVADLFVAPNIRALAVLILERRGSVGTGDTSFLPLSSSRVPERNSLKPKNSVFLVAGVGGSCLSFFALVRALGEDVEAYGLQPPQLSGDNSILFTSVADYASHYLTALQKQQPEGPYRLVGHSFGSFIAYEMALQLEEKGERVALALLDTPAPIAGRVMESALSIAELRYQGLHTVAEFAGANLPVGADEFCNLPRDVQDRHIEELCEHPQMPFGFATLCQFLDVYVNQSRLAYAPERQLHHASIALINALDSREFPRRSEFDDCSWREFSSIPLAVYVAPGDHLSMLHNPHAAVLAGHIHRALFTGNASHIATRATLEESTYE